MTCCCHESSSSPKGSRLCGNKPFQDSYFIAAQIISLIAFGMSFTWWVSLTLGAATMLTLQVAWCCKLSRRGMICTAVLSLLSALSSFGGALVALLVWSEQSLWACPIFLFWAEENGYGSDYCNEKAWSVVMFVQAILWFLVSLFVLSFARSDRYQECVAQFEQRGGSESGGSDDDVELANGHAVIVNATADKESLAVPDKQ